MISISNAGGAAPTFGYQFPHLLRLAFHDFAVPDNTGLSFRASQACDVIRFVKHLHESPTEYDLAVHCREGRSRSAAVAKWCAEFAGVEAKGRPADIGFGHANKLVLDMLYAAESSDLQADDITETAPLVAPIAGSSMATTMKQMLSRVFGAS